MSLTACRETAGPRGQKCTLGTVQLTGSLTCLSEGLRRGCQRLTVGACSCIEAHRH